MKNAREVFCLMIMGLFMMAGQSFGDLELNDGGIYDIWWNINNGVSVDRYSPDMGTTFNLLEGGEIVDLWGYNDSYVNVYGGKIGGHWHVTGNSEGMMSGGEIIGGSLYVTDNGKLLMSSGRIGVGSLFTSGNSDVTMSGGNIEGTLSATDNSRVTMHSGETEALCAIENSKIIMTGGNIDSLIAADDGEIMMSGGEIGTSITLSNQSVLTINGHDFAVDGIPIGHSGIYSCLGLDYTWEPTRRLTGILSSGDIIDNDFYIGENGAIFLVPEPATLLLLGFGCVALRRNRW